MSQDTPTANDLSPLKRALLAIEELQARLQAVEQQAREPIAVVGLGCRIPGGANGPESFWGLLREGRSGVREIPRDRWDVDARYDPNPDAPGKIATRFGGFLDEVDQFDPQFFGIAPREALSMDPQQRLLLEVSWEALEDAGQSPTQLGQSRTGVYFGICGNDYAQLLLERNEPALLDMYYASGIGHSIASGRLSYVLGLQGPSLSVDTACSSSLVAVHLACQGLRNSECRMALAGGVNVILSPEVFSALSRARMLAADGKCKAFDAAADGFVRGEGCGVVVLKRLSDALADNDRILALIRGSAVNQDGPSSGLTAPNGPAQESVIRQALANAGVSPREIGYVETHGTGTSLGDPIEMGALGAVFGPERDPASPLIIGSVKTNVGHLEAAAGVTGLGPFADARPDGREVLGATGRQAHRWSQLLWVQRHKRAPRRRRSTPPGGRGPTRSGAPAASLDRFGGDRRGVALSGSELRRASERQGTTANRRFLPHRQRRPRAPVAPPGHHGRHGNRGGRTPWTMPRRRTAARRRSRRF
jgi:3-oxoacyl-(acyl-carrier-protein) synthase